VVVGAGRERTERGVPVVQGKKDDTAKPDLYVNVLQMFPNALRQVALASKHGADKYGQDNWLNVDNSYQRYSAAMLRHTATKPCHIDEDSGLLHEAHTAWNALARLEILMKALETGDAIIPARKTATGKKVV
jgi:hypothetical protein